VDEGLPLLKPRYPWWGKKNKPKNKKTPKCCKHMALTKSIRSKKPESLEKTVSPTRRSLEKEKKKSPRGVAP